MRLGSYEIQAEIGRGAVGRVCRAVHAPTGAVRAVKILHGIGSVEVLERFRREAEALARLDGRGVVQVHETGVEGRTPWFAMDLVAGGSLRARLKERGGALPWSEAARLASKIARTLALCHAMGLVHRDLKPENVLLGEDGEPRLADFGLARDAGSSLTETGTVLGTPFYMAPEQLEGKPVDGKADVFALGALLYEMLTGRPASPGRNPIEILRAASSGRRVPAGALVRSPRALDQVLARALAPLAKDRPEAAELAEMLEHLPAAKVARGPLAALALVLVAALAVAAALGHERPATPEEAPRTGPMVRTPPVGSTVAPLETRVVDGIRAKLRDRSYFEAVGLCEKVRAERPGDEWLLAFEADCLLDAGDVERALAFVGSCADAGPGGARAHAVRAFVHARRNELEDAREEADCALARDESLARAWVARSLVLSATTDLATSEEAADAARRARGLAPPALGAAHDAFIGANRRGLVDSRGFSSFDELEANKDGEGVFEHHAYENVMPRPGVRLSEEVSALVEARRLARKEDWAAVVTAVASAIKVNPLRPATHALAGQALSRLGDAAGALAAFERGLALDSGSVDLNDSIAILLGEAGHADRALSYADAAARIAPSADRSLRLATLCEGVGDEEGLATNLDRAIAADTSKPEALVYRAGLFLRRGRPALALEDAGAAIKRKPGDATAYLVRAHAETDLGKLDEALADCDRAAATNPKNPFVHLERARSVERRDRAKARAELETFRRLATASEWENAWDARLLEERLKGPP